MFSFRKALVAATAIAASFAVVSSPAVAADPLYPDAVDVQITLDLSFRTAVGGTNLTIHAEAESGGKPIAGKMTVNAFGRTYADNDNDLRITVKTPVVTKREVNQITARFVPTDNARFRTATASKNVTLLPRGSDTDGSGGILPDSLLPNTGGINSWFLIVGGLLFAAGAAVVTAARKRSKNSV